MSLGRIVRFIILLAISFVLWNLIMEAMDDLAKHEHPFLSAMVFFLGIFGLISLSDLWHKYVLKRNVSDSSEDQDYKSFPPLKETKVNAKITLAGELPPLSIDAEEDLLLASQKCLDNFGSPQIDYCKILNDQVYFYDINGYLSMTIPKEALDQWLLTFEKIGPQKATDTDALIRNLKNKLETPINDRLVYPVFGHEIGESSWECFMLDTHTGEIRKMTEEEKAKIPRY